MNTMTSIPFRPLPSFGGTLAERLERTPAARAAFAAAQARKLEALPRRPRRRPAWANINQRMAAARTEIRRRHDAALNLIKD